MLDRKELVDFQSVIDNWRSRVHNTNDSAVQNLYRNDAQKLQQILEFLKYGQTAPARKLFQSLDHLLYSRIPNSIREFLLADQSITESFHGDILKAFPLLASRSDLKIEIVSILDHTVRDQDVRDAITQIAALLDADGYIDHRQNTEQPDSFWKDTAALIVDRGNDQPTLIYDVESRDFIISTPSLYIDSLRKSSGVEGFLDQEDLPEQQIRIGVRQHEINELVNLFADEDDDRRESTLKALKDPRIRKLLDQATDGHFHDLEVDDRGYVNYRGDISLSYMRLEKIPVPFGTVGGNLYCYNNQLTSLQGAPESVGGNFYCYNNQLQTLEGAPTSVGGYFDCSNNQLQTLEGAPASVGGDFFCPGNQLQTLEGAPASVGGNFNCSENPDLPEEEVRRYRESKAVRGRIFESREQNTQKQGINELVNLFADEDDDRRESTLKALKDPRIRKLLNQATDGHFHDLEVDDRGYVNFSGSIDLSGMRFDMIPVPFGTVGGDFNCYSNQLRTLEGAPESVGGYFDCAYSQLQTLEGAPESVGGGFYCAYNQLQTLEGAPESVGGDFWCYNNQLQTLEGAPASVGGNFYCSENPDLPEEEVRRYRESEAVRGRIFESREQNSPRPAGVNKLTEVAMNQYLYVYDGPGGPISKIFTSDSDSAAMDLAEARSSSWFDDQENDLELDPGALVDKQSIQRRGFLAFGFINAGIHARIYRTTAALSSIEEGVSFSNLKDFLYVYDGPEHPEGPVSVYVYGRNIEDALNTVNDEFVDWIDEDANDLLLASGEKISKRVVEINGFLPNKYEVISQYERLFFSEDATPNQQTDPEDIGESQHTQKHGINELVNLFADEDDDRRESTLKALKDPRIRKLLDQATDGHFRDLEVDDQGYVNYQGDISLSYMRLEKIPVPFGTVGGDFNCYNNQLQTLEGAPASVGGYFDCSNNQLQTLEGAPTSVGGGFYCAYNQLQTLEGAPESVGGNFDCAYNQLQTLEGAPKSVSGGFFCYSNQLQTLEGAPESVGGDFYCHRNELTSLQGAPESVGGSFYCHGNRLHSLRGAPESVGGYFDCSYNQLQTLEGAPASVGGNFYCSENPDLPEEEVRRYRESKAVRGVCVESKQRGLQKRTPLLETSNRDVIKAFMEDSFPKNRNPSLRTENLRIRQDGRSALWGIQNYSTWLVVRNFDGTLYFNSQRYSATTSKIQTYIRAEAVYQGLNMIETDEDGIRKILDAPNPLVVDDTGERIRHNESRETIQDRPLTEEKSRRSLRRGLLPAVGFSRMYPFDQEDVPDHSGASVTETERKPSVIDRIREHVRKGTPSK